jgi:hypothetical protein
VSTSGTPIDLANDAADAGSMTLSGLASGEHLFVRAGSVESRTPLHIRRRTNYTTGMYDNSGATTLAGGAATNIGARGEVQDIVGTGDTTDPTTSASDQASTMVALNENLAASSATPQRL